MQAAFDPKQLIDEARPPRASTTWAILLSGPRSTSSATRSEHEAGLTPRAASGCAAGLSATWCKAARGRRPQAHPRTADVPITAPIIVNVNGLSGTTLMHKLLAECEGNRAVPELEMPGRRLRRSRHLGTDPRIAELEASSRRTVQAARRHGQASLRRRPGPRNARRAGARLRLRIYGPWRARRATRRTARRSISTRHTLHRWCCGALLTGPQDGWCSRRPSTCSTCPSCRCLSRRRGRPDASRPARGSRR